MTDCRHCGVVHDPEIHEAVNRVRADLRSRLNLITSYAPAADAPLRQKPTGSREQTSVRLNRVERMRASCPKQRVSRPPRAPRPERHKLTGEYVLEQLKSGVTTYQLAKQLGMHPSYVSRRLHEVVDGQNAEATAAYAALLVCPICKEKKKLPERPACSGCAKNAKRKAARAARGTRP